MTRSPVWVCCHSSSTCATSPARTNFSNTRVLVVPTTCRRPGSITEKISFISTELAAAVLQEQHTGRRRPARHVVRRVAEERLLLGRSDRAADIGDIEHDIGVSGAGGTDREQPVAVELIHGGHRW